MRLLFTSLLELLLIIDDTNQYAKDKASKDGFCVNFNELKRSERYIKHHLQEVLRFIR